MAKKTPRKKLSSNSKLMSTTQAFNKFAANERAAGRPVSSAARVRLLKELRKSAGGKAVNPNKKR